MPKSKVWIVKLGGSLARAPELPQWLTVLASSATTCVVVPGAGCFADPIKVSQRHWSYGDSCAHQMALLGMAQYGLLLHAIEPRLHLLHGLGDALATPRVTRSAIWLPELGDLTRMADLPADWTVSADSIALWLAEYLGADELRLIKSRAPLCSAHAASALAAEQFLDTYFPILLPQTGVRVRWYAKTEVGEFVRNRVRRGSREIGRDAAMPGPRGAG
ncbi:MAG: hypothetical protein ACREXT_09455 [Gammaproteobacteria bacterium]